MGLRTRRCRVASPEINAVELVQLSSIEMGGGAGGDGDAGGGGGGGGDGAAGGGGDTNKSAKPSIEPPTNRETSVAAHRSESVFSSQLVLAQFDCLIWFSVA